MSHFKEILVTLGASNIEVLRDNTKWGLWKAEYSTPISTVTGYYLYLKSKCPLKEATARNISHWETLSKDNAYEVIVTPKSSLSQDLDNTRKKFKGASARTSKQLLWDNFLGDIKFKPISTEEYFVEPSLEVESVGVVSDSLNFLQNWLTNTDSDTKSGLAILVANGGVGKTTVSRKLCANINKRDPSVIPILIESDQWKHLVESTVTLDTLWDLAISRRFEKVSMLLSNETALRALIQEGVFVIIFDGFDELCAAGHAPKEIVNELYGMVETDDGSYNARILITARETFWSSISEDVTAEAEIDVFRLKGFDNEQKKKFFKNRLNDLGERDLALRMAKEISGSIYSSIEKEDQNEDRPSGIPFVLSLIAHYVEGNPDAVENIYQGDPLQRLLEDICRRENKRQTLDIGPEKQMMLFEELYREFPKEFTLDDLKMYLSVICDVSDGDVVNRFTSHAFIDQVEKNVFAPRYEVLRVYFVARFLAKGLRAIEDDTKNKQVVKILAEQSTGKTQVLEWLINQLRNLDDEYLLAAIHHSQEIIKDHDNHGARKEASKALFFVLISLLDEKEKMERTRELKKYLAKNGGELNFTGVIFAGLVKSFDFSDSKFTRCTFIDAEFKNCKFGKSTLFSDCLFEGELGIDWCDGEEDAQLKSCQFSKEAGFKWDTVHKTGTNEKVRREFAEEALERALRKFKGGVGFKGIQIRHRNTGFRKGNPYSSEIWKKIEKHKIIDQHPISGVDKGGIHLTEDKKIRREITQFLDNGVIGRALEVLIKDIIE